MPLRKRLYILFVFLLCTLAIYVYHLLHIDRLSAEDWEYFNGLSYFVKSSILGFHTFPIHNPWSCGGLDLLTNPQNRIFSPFLFADLLFYPPFSNLISLIILSFIGLWGTFLLLQELELSISLSIIGSILFINSSWFGLHFIEGHITFAEMQVLPLVTYFALKLKDSPRYFFYLCMTFAFFILDGAIYALFFSLCTIASIYATRWGDAWIILKLYLREHKRYAISVVVIALLLSVPKILPLVLHPPSVFYYTSHDHKMTMPFSFWFNAFLNPDQNIYTDGRVMYPFTFHEFGTYFSPLALLFIFCTFLLKPKFFRRNWSYLLIGIFWFWIATGLFPNINPWQYTVYLPFFNRLHLQSRTVIICFLFFVILLMKGLAALKKKFPIPVYIFASLLLLESFYVRIHSNLNPRARIVNFDHLIQSTNVDFTTKYSRTPEHYLAFNTGSARCYEPSFFPRYIFYSGQIAYKGEVYSIPANTWLASLKSYTPKGLEINFEKKANDGFLRLNTNALYGWKVLSGNADVYGSERQNLDIHPHQDSGTIMLKYEPWYLDWCLASFGTGFFLLFGFVFFRRKNFLKDKESSGFNYSAFPAGYYHDVIREGHPVRRAWHRQKFKKVIGILPKGEGMSILDIGCFAGTFLSFLDRRQFSRQVGVDILRKQIDYAQVNVANEFREFIYIKSLADLDFKGEKFDCITLIEVIEHLETDEVHEVLNKATDLLKPGGKIIITTPNYFSFWPLIEIAINSFSEVSYEEQHITKFSFFNFLSKIRKIVPSFDQKFLVESRITGLFITPFLAYLSPKLSEMAFERFGNWGKHFPFGNLLFFSFKRTQVP